MDRARQHGGTAICVLAGGEATRLPAKLGLEAGDVPMLVRVVRNVSTRYDVWLSTKGPLPAALARHVGALPQVVDRWPGRGPLSGLLSTLSAMPHAWVFALAGDAPFVSAKLVDALCAYAGEDCDAVVPRNDGVAQPLAALYRRTAFLREGAPVLTRGGGVRAVIERLRTRFVAMDDARAFVNVNTPADYARLREVLATRHVCEVLA